MQNLSDKQKEIIEGHAMAAMKWVFDNYPDIVINEKFGKEVRVSDLYKHFVEETNKSYGK